MSSEEVAHQHNGLQRPSQEERTSSSSDEDFPTPQPSYRPKRTLGILSDRETDEVPGMFSIHTLFIVLIHPYLPGHIEANGM